jgi:nicotinamidase-related amidase
MSAKNATALLVIDVQNDLTDGEMVAYHKDQMLANIAALLAQARGTGTPVVFVQHEEPDYPRMRAGAEGWQINPAVAPQPGERIIHKRACDAFCGTPLRQELDDLGVTHLVVTGMQTDYCVDTACRRALSLDYDVTLVADGHSTFDNGLLTAKQIIAHHNGTLANLPHPKHRIEVKPSREVRFD